LSSPSSYPLSETENGYVFITDLGLPYAITFLDCSSYLQESDLYGTVSLYEFAFSIEQGYNRSNYDPRIEPTIANTIEQFFILNSQDAVVVTYDSSDRKQDARKRLFDRWYNQYSPARPIKQFNYTIDIPEVHRSAHMILVRKDHPYLNKIDQGITAWIDLLHSDK